MKPCNAEKSPARPRPRATAGVPFLRRLAWIVPRSLAVASLLVLSVAAQSPGIPGSQPGIDHGQAGSRLPAPQEPSFEPNLNPILEAKRIKALNQMRHKAMVDDAARLLVLARELNDDSRNLSPADRVHKAAEIEKLAKSVKEKMTFTVGNDTATPSKFSTTMH